MDEKMKKRIIKALKKMIEKYKDPFKKDGKLKMFFNREHCALCKIFYKNYLSIGDSDLLYEKRKGCRSDCPNFPKIKNSKYDCGHINIKSFNNVSNTWNDFIAEETESSKQEMIKAFKERAEKIEEYLKKFEEKHEK